MCWGQGESFIIWRIVYIRYWKTWGSKDWQSVKGAFGTTGRSRCIPFLPFSRGWSDEDLRFRQNFGNHGETRDGRKYTDWKQDGFKGYWKCTKEGWGPELRYKEASTWIRWRDEQAEDRDLRIPARDFKRWESQGQDITDDRWDYRWDPFHLLSRGPESWRMEP